MASTLPNRNTLEGGTSGTTISNANSGGASGTAFDVITGTPKFSNAHVHNGSMAMICDTTASALATSPQWTFSGAVSSNIYARFYIYITAIPVTTTTIIWSTFDNAGTPVRNIAMRHMITTGNYQFINSAGTQQLIGTKPIPLNQWVRFDIRLLPTTSGGQIECYMFSGANLENSILGTADDHVTATGLVISGNGSVINTRFGPAGTVAASYVAYFDDVAINTLGFIGPSPDKAKQLVLPSALPRAAVI